MTNDVPKTGDRRNAVVRWLESQFSGELQGGPG